MFVLNLCREVRHTPDVARVGVNLQDLVGRLRGRGPTATVAGSEFRGHSDTLLALAGRAIAYGLENRGYLPLDLADFPPDLHQVRSAFVTLRQNGDLRGCIGSVEAHRPLVEEVARNAHAAAFNDPRFPALGPEEWPATDCTIEILSPAQALPFTSEAELLASLVPGVDGLILEAGGRRAGVAGRSWVGAGGDGAVGSGGGRAPCSEERWAERRIRAPWGR